MGKASEGDDLDNEDEDSSSKPIQTPFELRKTLTAKSELEETHTVDLWLGMCCIAISCCKQPTPNPPDRRDGTRPNLRALSPERNLIHIVTGGGGETEFYDPEERLRSSCEPIANGTLTKGFSLIAAQLNLVPGNC
ncbi:hypothetical protein F5146DRAFT_1002018 [Armillaria mellea]|nr:hypothetical protein F5146DRAFT_1002018 [Armillaria mellea]